MSLKMKYQSLISLLTFLLSTSGEGRRIRWKVSNSIRRDNQMVSMRLPCIDVSNVTNHTQDALSLALTLAHKCNLRCAGRCSYEYTQEEYSKYSISPLTPYSTHSHGIAHNRHIGIIQEGYRNLAKALMDVNPPLTPAATLVPDGASTPILGSTSLPNSRTVSMSNLEQAPKTPYGDNQFMKLPRHAGIQGTPTPKMLKRPRSTADLNLVSPCGSPSNRRRVT